jgi:uncharacterized NAD-dependent epimerase/dehydratase family protein
MLSPYHAKTAYGVMRYGRDAVVAVMDREHAGQRMSDVAPQLGCGAPIVATLDEAMRERPTSLLIGVATSGGYSPPAFRPTILHAIDAGLEIVSGLHTLLAEDQEFVTHAAASGAVLWDVRVPPADIGVFSGKAYDVPQTVVLAVGSDCSTGKMSAMLEIERLANQGPLRTEFVATGQTGILIAGKGIAVDRVISDFVAGAAERLLLDVEPSASVALVEGQGSIYHPAFAAVTFGLLLGSAPDLLLVCHDVSRAKIEGFEVAIPPLGSLVAAHHSYLAHVKPARCVAIALNTSSVDERAAREAIAAAEFETGLPADDPIRFGASKLWAAMASAVHLSAKAVRARQSRDELV